MLFDIVHTTFEETRTSPSILRAILVTIAAEYITKAAAEYDQACMHLPSEVFYTE